MNIKSINNIHINTNQTGFAGKPDKKPEGAKSSTPMYVKIPLATFIAMSPLAPNTVTAQDKLPLPAQPEKVVVDNNRLQNRSAGKTLAVKTFFNVNGENYIVRTKDLDNDSTNFESILISQATPNSIGSRYEAEEISKYNFAPLADDEANNGFFTVKGVKAQDIVDTQKVLIANDEFLEYFDKLAQSPENNGAIEIVNHNENLVPLPSGRVVISYEDGNLWKDAHQYVPEGEFMGHKILEGDNGIYDISIYNSDKQTLTAEEFTLKKEGYPELKIDKMIKVKSSFATNNMEPVSFETYQFNLKDNDGVTTIIYDKTLGEYMEKVAKSALYNKNNVPFDKAEVAKDYKISASTENIYIDDKK